MQNDRKMNDETEFYLYNIENYLLCGVSVDRTKNSLASAYDTTEDEQFNFGT